MELHLTPETEAKLNDLALRTHRDVGELVAEAVENLMHYTAWLETKVKSSIAAAKRGEITPDDDVREWLEARERGHASRLD